MADPDGPETGAAEALRSTLAQALASAGPGALRALVEERLATAGVPSPAADARWLVAAAAARSRPSHGGEAAARSGRSNGGEAAARSGRSNGGEAEADVDIAALASMVARRVAREPLQVVLGTTAFRHVTLVARSGVFVPRPETEVVAGIAIDAALAVESRPARVVDACTGSGTIALAVASEVPRVQVVATELDEDALALARANLDALRVRTPSDPGQRRWRPGDHLAPGADVEVVAADLLDGVDEAWRGTIDVLVANPPYLPAGDRGSWQPEVAGHDPDEALVGGPDGHEVVDRLLQLAGQWLRPGGTVVVEIDDRRGSQALAAAERSGLVDCEVVADLTGRDRALVGVRPIYL